MFVLFLYKRIHESLVESIVSFSSRSNSPFSHESFLAAKPTNRLCYTVYEEIVRFFNHGRFPYVQSRIGKYEYEDKKMLCIAASDFYHKVD